jgi:hypothetical protein
MGWKMIGYLSPRITDWALVAVLFASQVLLTMWIR